MVVAQLVERSLPNPKVRGSNPVIGKNLPIFLLNICFLSTVYRKDENKGKRGREWPIFLKKHRLKVFLKYFLTFNLNDLHIFR